MFAISLFARELNHVTANQPTPTELNKTETKVLLFYLNHLGPPSAKRYFRIAQFYIQMGNLQEAKVALTQALDIDPSYLPALTQLGFVSLWAQEWEEAEGYFTAAWDLIPCNSKITIGLIRLAIHWVDEKKWRALKIVDQLHACSFSDPEIFFSLGVLEMRLSLLGFAEDSFNQCLSLSPHYEDAEIGLADLYVIERKYKEAEAIYQEFPERNEALSGLALIAERTGNFSLAETLYRKALENTPKDWELRERLARVLTNKLQYDKAKEEYAILLEENPSERLWIRSMNVKSHTNVALLEEINYTNAKENDPTLGVPVVKDYYFLSRFTLLVPVVNKWRLDAQQIYFYQRENNIYAPSVNYSASINGGAMLSHFYFAKDWKWDVILKGIQATGIQNANFPFQKGALFEPGTVLTYNGDWHFFALDAHVEEQIIKNFAYTISQMLRIDVYNGGYGIHPPVAFHPNGEFSVGQNFYHDSIHNWKQYQKIRVDSDLFVSPIRVTYLFEHSRFKKLSPDYFTYLKQIQNTLSFRFLHDFGAGVQLEATWDYFLQSNTDVILPIGTFIFIAPSLYLIGNRATGLLRYRFQDHLRFEISGHYLHVSTLPYRDWNLKGSLFWQF